MNWFIKTGQYILLVVMLAGVGILAYFMVSEQSSSVIKFDPVLIMDRPLSEMTDEYLQSNIDNLYKSMSTEPHRIEWQFKASTMISIYQNELILRKVSK